MEELKERKEQKLSDYILEILLDTWLNAEALNKEEIINMANLMAKRIGGMK